MYLREIVFLQKSNASTTGAILFTALHHAQNEFKGFAVVISPDDAFKYASSYAPYIKGKIFMESPKNFDKALPYARYPFHSCV